MKILSWNCQGLGNPRTVRALKKLINNYQPDIIFLMETKLMTTQYHFLNMYNDNYSTHTINCSVIGGGRAGGLALIWNHCNVSMDIKSFDLNYIDMSISNSTNNQSWRATGIYGFPQAQNKYLTCQLINDLSCINECTNWLVFGDLNLVLSNEEKSGGNPIEPNITTSFRNTLCMCNLQDLGFKGSIYTWTNKHHGDNIIHSRLDRFLATTDWISMFPNYLNTHLVRYKSDHCPILLEFSQFFCNRSKPSSHYLKKFEQVWTTDADHINIVLETWQQQSGSLDRKLQHTLNALHSWGSKSFGIIPQRIKKSQQDLHRLQQLQPNHHLNSQILNKEKELDELLEKEELWWSQRSRTLWLRHGDKNTKFFHQKASQRRRKNTIESIQDPSGTLHTDQEEIEAIFTSHFQNLFSSQQTTNIEDIVQVVNNKIDQDMHDDLTREFTAEEVLYAIKNMKSLAAPGPDGLPAKFYHTYWDIIGNDITSEVLNIPNHEGNPQTYNNTHICLIPKTNNPTQPSDFRPISLCNVTLKIVTKTIANRLKTILPSIIGPNQSAFVPGRLITENTIIANEIFHYLTQTTRKTGYVSIKTDMAKAYDRLEWDFLEATLKAMNFPTNIINTIMRCVSTVSFSILINGKPTKSFIPERGLRQGDPLSPYLFILCADVFSGLIAKAQAKSKIHGVKIAPSAPEITHLFFADDSIIFCRANEEETNKVKSIISKYQQASGQLVNYNKSELLFSKKVPQEMKLNIQQILPMNIVDHYSKYLGQPTFIGRSKKQVFNFIQDKVWHKLKG
jgi:exonuclease III